MKDKFLLILVSSLVFFVLVGFFPWTSPVKSKELDYEKISREVLPEEGFTLKIKWGDIGPRLVELGVIDLAKFEQAIPMSEEQKKILTEGGDISIKIDQEN